MTNQSQLIAARTSDDRHRAHDESSTTAPATGVPDEVLQVLRDTAADVEEEGWIVPAALDALRAAGAFSLAGADDEPFDHERAVAVLQQLGAVNPSAAWVAALTTAATGLLPYATTEAADAVRVSAAPVVENFAPGSVTRGEDGYVLQGRWPYSSGSEVATYAMLGALELEDGRPPRMRVAVVPVAGLQLVRTWDVPGLQGTGSHTLVAQDVPVPDAFVFDLPTDPEVAGRAVLSTTTGTAAAITGMALGALDVVTTLVQGGTGPSRTRYGTFADSPGSVALYASARARIREAAERVAAVAVRQAAGQEPLDRTARLELRHTLIEAVRQARGAVDDLCDLHGSSAFARANPLQRFWRDIGVGSRHIGLRGHIVDEDLGRALAGRDDFAMPLS